MSPSLFDAVFVLQEPQLRELLALVRPLTSTSLSPARSRSVRALASSSVGLSNIAHLFGDVGRGARVHHQDLVDALARLAVAGELVVGSEEGLELRQLLGCQVLASTS
jgi:hypothetical protein